MFIQSSQNLQASSSIKDIKKRFQQVSKEEYYKDRYISKGYQAIEPRFGTLSKSRNSYQPPLLKTQSSLNIYGDPPTQASKFTTHMPGLVTRSQEQQKYVSATTSNNNASQFDLPLLPKRNIVHTQYGNILTHKKNGPKLNRSSEVLSISTNTKLVSGPESTNTDHVMINELS